MEEDLYELHVCERGRWTCAERFRSAEKEEALSEAKRLFASPSIEAVRVIREVFDEREQIFKQRTVYRNAKPKSEVAPAKAAPAKAAAAPARRAVAPMRAVSRAELASSPSPAPSAAPLPALEEPERVRAGHSLARRVITATAVAVVLAGFGLAALSTGAADRVLGGVDDTAVYGGIMGLFLAAFAISLFLFSRTRREIAVPRPAAPAAEDAPAIESITPIGPSADEPQPANRAGHSISVGSAESDRRSSSPDARPDAPVPPDDLSLESFLGAPESGASPAETAKSEPAKSEPAKPEPAELSAASTLDRETLLRFFRDCLMHPATQGFVAEGKMSPHNRFGCHLFMYGAGEACLAASRSDPALLGPVIQSALEMLGTDAERAKTFIARGKDYLRDDKYRAMIQAGQRAMEQFNSGNGGSASTMAQALKAWNASETQPNSDVIVIMFTDMVSSVQTTQALGDEGMMKLVQTHNLIVGSVLKTHRGHQVKHTGDGIMAVFPRVADGVAAACEIQRQIAEHNRVTASTFLKVRMGLAAGQPIRDQDDYFGTVVQLAARLCACAGEAEICVAGAISDLVSGNKAFIFSDVREVQLKGFADAQKMRYLIWSDAERAVQFAAGQPHSEPRAPAA